MEGSLLINRIIVLEEEVKKLTEELNKLKEEKCFGAEK